MSSWLSRLARSNRHQPPVRIACPHGRCAHVPDFDIKPNPAFYRLCWCGQALPWAAPLAEAAAVPITKSRYNEARATARRMPVPARIAALALFAVVMRGDAAALTTFQESVAFEIDRIEGSALVVDDCGHGKTRYGINEQANRGIDIERLTRAQAIAIYRRYWDGIDADHLPDALRLAAFDAAVNMGVSRARILMAQAHGDVSALLRLREQFHAYLARHRPACAPFARIWQRRDRLIALASQSVI